MEDLQALQKQLRFLKAVIVILLIFLVTLLYFILRSSAASLGFREVYSSDTALDGIKKYRNMFEGSVHKKTRIILYDSTDIVDYMLHKYPAIADSLRKKMPDTCKCKIMVGFYLMRANKKGTDTPRNSFFVIPTFVDTTNPQTRLAETDRSKWKIYDFREDTTIYMRPVNATKTAKAQPPIVYDAGQMYP